MKHVPRQSAAAAVVAGAAVMAADAAVAAAVGVAATVAVVGAAVIAATVEIAGKQAPRSESAAPRSRSVPVGGASVPLRESSAVSLRQSFTVAALTSAGSTRLIRLKGSCEYLLPADKISRMGIGWSIKSNVCGFPRHVAGFVVRQQERNWSVAHDQDTPRSAFPGP